MADPAEQKNGPDLDAKAKASASAQAAGESESSSDDQSSLEIKWRRRRRKSDRRKWSWAIAASVALAVAIGAYAVWQIAGSHKSDTPEASGPASVPASVPASPPSSTTPPRPPAATHPPISATVTVPVPPGIFVRSVTVNNGPLPGQESRASDNFAIQMPPGTSKLIWQVGGSPRGVRFALIRDKRFGDEVQITDITDGATTRVVTGDHLYIGRVEGASKPFPLTIYAK
jgi:hypothetical protein